jgi:hypothetical protein
MAEKRLADAKAGKFASSESKPQFDQLKGLVEQRKAINDEVARLKDAYDKADPEIQARVIDKQLTELARKQQQVEADIVNARKGIFKQKTPKQAQDELVALAQKHLNDTRKQYEEIFKLSEEGKKSVEERYTNLLEKRKAQLEEEVKKGVYVPKQPRIARDLTEKQEQIALDISKLKQEFANMKFRYEWQQKSKWAKSIYWIDAMRYTNLLSNPQSHERNISGNAFNAFVVRPLSLAGRGDVKGLQTYISKAGEQLFSGKAFRQAAKSWQGKLADRTDKFDNPRASMFDVILNEIPT